MREAVRRYPKFSKLHILKAYFLHIKMKNKFRAIFELRIAEESKPTIQEEFLLYRLKMLIEVELLEQDRLDRI